MVAGFFGIFSRFHRLQLLPISQEKESARGRSSSSGQLAGGLRRRPPARLWVWRAWPLGGRLLARLPLLVSCVARSGVCCLGGFVARRVPPRCGRFGCPPRACCPRGWVRDRLPLGQRLRRSLGGCGFWGVLRRRQLPRRAARSLPSWAFSRRAGAGLGRSVVAPGGRRGLSPVLAVCLWDSVVAPCPRLRAVAARCGGLPVRPWVPGCLSWLLPRSTSRGFCPSWAAAPVALWTRWTEQPPAHLTTPLYRKLAIPARLCYNYIANKMIARNPRHLRQVNRGFRHVQSHEKPNI